MANAWQLRFQPTIIAVTPQRGGTFRTVKNATRRPAASTFKAHFKMVARREPA